MNEQCRGTRNSMLAITKPMFILAYDGHLFACKHEGANVLLTNEYGCQTRMDWAYAVQLLGFQLMKPWVNKSLTGWM